MPGTLQNLPPRIFHKQSRAVLLAGFGGLLLLMAFAGIDGLRVLRQMQERSGTIQRDFLERSRVLNQIRSDVYLSGTYTRDYLLDPLLSAADKNRSELNRLRKEMDAILASYAGLMSAEERTPLDGLRRSLNEYWHILDPVFHWNPRATPRRRFRVLA